MPGFYHLMSNPLLTTALDTDPDPNPAEDDGSGTAAQILRRLRYRKFRQRVLTWLGAQAVDWGRCANMSLDDTLVIFETDAALPAGIPALIDALFLNKNRTLAQARAYLAANRSNWG